MRSSRSCGGSAAAAARQRCSSVARARERRARRGHRRERAPPVAIAGGRAAADSAEQVVVARAEQRAAQGARERQPMRRRDDRVEHRDQVLRLGRRGQRGVLDRRVGDVLALERGGDEAQRLALAAEHVDSPGARARHELGADRAAATAAASRSRSTSRARGAASSACRARSAPTFAIAAGRRAGRADARQGRDDLARRRRRPRWCAGESPRTRRRSSPAEHAVDRGDHRGRVAARVVAGQDAALQALADEARAASKTRGSAPRKR